MLIKPLKRLVSTWENHRKQRKYAYACLDWTEEGHIWQAHSAPLCVIR